MPRIAAFTAIALALALPAAAQEFPPPQGGAGSGIGTLPAAPPADAEPAEEAAPERPAPAGQAPEAAPEEGAPAGEAPEGEGEAPAGPAAETPPAEAPEAGAAAEPGEPEVFEIVRETFNDWEVRCAPDGDECFLYQIALDGDDNPVAEFSLVRLTGGEAAAGATVVTPLGTLLPAGLTLRIDGGELRQYPFTFCSQVGCFAQLAFNQAQLQAMQRGRVARIGVTSIGAPEDPVELEVSLIGFTAAYGSLAGGEGAGGQ